MFVVKNKSKHFQIQDVLQHMDYSLNKQTNKQTTIIYRTITFDLTQDIQSDRRIRQDHARSDIGTLRKSPETLIKPVRSDPVFTGILTNGFRSGFCRKRSDQILSYTVARNHPNRQNPSTRRQRFSQYFDRIPSDFTDKN